MYDLVVSNGRVVDPGQELDGLLDVGITAGRIESVAEKIPPSEGRQVVDARGKILTPGLIDLHSHVYHALDLNGNHPDTVGVGSGVTTVVDAGSAGSSVFGGFPQYVIPAAVTSIYCFLNLARTGLLAVPEISVRGDVDVEGIRRVVAAHRGLIRGLKFRATGAMADTIGPEMVQLARQLSTELGLPLMVHIGQMDPSAKSTLTQEVLTTLGAGDILSHIYTGRPGAVVGADNRVVPELYAAVKRGVLLDVGHGRSNISFAVARRLLEEGILPDIISSDLIARHVGAPSYGSLTEVMSQFLALGLSLGQVVRMTTVNPARALGLEDRLGSLAVGRLADLTVLEAVEGDWPWVDTEGQRLQGRMVLVPALTVKGGRLIRVDLSPRFTRFWGPAG